MSYHANKLPNVHCLLLVVHQPLLILATKIDGLVTRNRYFDCDLILGIKHNFNFDLKNRHSSSYFLTD